MARVAFAARHLDPHATEVRAVAPRVWLTSLPGLDRLEANARTRTASFLLAIGFSLHSKESASLIASSYPTVYTAAARDRLPYEMRRWIVDLLPPRPWWRQWDRCERLSLGLVQRFVQHEWPLEDFVRATSSRDAFRQALDAAKEEKWTRDLVRRIKKDFDRGDLVLGADQRDVLRDY